MKNAEEKAREFTEDLARTLKSLVGLAMSIEECQTFVNAVVNETMNEYANQQPEVDYQKMFANCSLPNETHKLRESAEKVVQKWKGKCAITSSDIQKLEEALNQNGLNKLSF